MEHSARRTVVARSPKSDRPGAASRLRSAASGRTDEARLCGARRPSLVKPTNHPSIGRQRRCSAAPARHRVDRDGRADGFSVPKYAAALHRRGRPHVLLSVTIAVWVGYDNGDGRGTAHAIGSLSPYVAGKTGTTEDAKRRSLGTTATGARVALPIFEPILHAVWAQGIAPKAPLNGPSPEAKRHLVDLPIDYMSGSRINGGGGHRRAFPGRD